MRDLLFPSAPPLTDALRASARAAAAAFAAEVRAVAAMYEAAPDDQREFVAGEVACVLHLSPVTGGARLATALQLTAQPQLLAALEHGRLLVPHVLALLSEVAHLDRAHATAVLAEVLDGHPAEDAAVPVGATPGELRSAARRAAIALDPALARARHATAKQTAGVRGRPGADGMGQVVIDCTAVEMATAVAAIRGRAAAIGFADDDLTHGQRQVAALLHALGCERASVQAVLECPVDRAVEVHALAAAPVWSVDVRMPIAVALGLSDHPAVLAGYGPIDADQARSLLPTADLVHACVDSRTGEVLAVEPPVRARTWRRGDDAARALRDELVRLATSQGLLTDLTTEGYVPSEALGRLVDLRDVTSVFPGDSTPARRTDRDHRLPWPLGPTSAENLQTAGRHWHRAKHAGWHTQLLEDGTVRWTGPSGGVYSRRPKRTPPPPIFLGAELPPLPGPPAPHDR